MADRRSAEQIPSRHIGKGPDGGVVAARGVDNERLKSGGVLRLPMELLWSALNPMAVLSMPMVLITSEPAPLAVLLLPEVLLWSALIPLAVFWLPVVLCASVSVPRLV